MNNQPNSTRRSFLQDSMALCGPASAVLKAAPSDRVNFGVIGVGSRGTHVMQAFQAVPDVNIVAVTDLYDGHLANIRDLSEGKIQTVKDYYALLDRKDIDAVIIATPDHWHKAMVLDAVAAGKDVYCEKPLTWAPAEGKEIIRAMRNTSRILQVGSQDKSSLVTAKAKEIVKSGVLGKITQIRRSRCSNSEDAAYRWPIPPDASPKTVDWSEFLGTAPKKPWTPEHFFRWRCWWEYSGGLATDLFVHEVTTLNEILDLKLPKSVVSQGGIFRWNDGRTVPDQLTSIFEYHEGFNFILYANHANSHGEPNWGHTIMGTNATLVIGGPEGILTIYPEPPASSAVWGAACWPRTLREQYYESVGFTPEGKPKAGRPVRKPEVVKVEQESSNPVDRSMTRHIRFFLQSVKERTPSVEDAQVGDYAALACHGANQSYREQRRISFDPEAA
jgi:predicted dehydrogenase